MSAVIPFAAAAKPRSFVPQQFIQNLHMRIHAFDEAQTDFENLGVEIGGLPFRPRKTYFRQSIAPLHRSFMKAAVESTLFIGFCMKNIAFMKMATDKIKGAVEAELGVHAVLFADQGHLKGEMAHFKDVLFTGLDGLQALRDEGQFGAVKMRQWHGDPFSATFLQDRALQPDDFHDWVEFNFMTRFRLPLGLNPMSPQVERVIAGNAASRHRSDDILDRLSIHDPEARLNANFPGLSLDAEPKTSAQLQRTRKGIAVNAFFQPDTTARVIETGAGASRTRKRAARPHGPRTPGGPKG